MEKQTELKPCPFCGGTNLDVLNVLEENPEYELFGMTKDNWNVVCPKPIEDHPESKVLMSDDKTLTALVESLNRIEKKIDVFLSEL